MSHKGEIPKMSRKGAIPSVSLGLHQILHEREIALLLQLMQSRQALHVGNALQCNCGIALLHGDGLRWW
jgi:hypothetical protein